MAKNNTQAKKVQSAQNSGQTVIEVVCHEQDRRAFKNPLHRLAIPRDFPEIREQRVDTPEQGADVLRFLQKRLAAVGETLNSNVRIHLAYPRKHPLLFEDQGLRTTSIYVDDVAHVLRTHAPQIDLHIAKEICELRHLDRSGDETIAHSLTGAQYYDIYAPGGPSPLLNPSARGRDLFLILDHNVVQGSTIANMASYITHNGGVVLGAMSPIVNCPPLAQVRGKSPLTYGDRRVNGQMKAEREKVASDVKKAWFDAVPPAYADKDHNNRALLRLSLAFAKDSHRPPAESLKMFTDAMQGNWVASPLSMTQGECENLVRTLGGLGLKDSYGMGGYRSFSDILTELKEARKAADYRAALKLA